MTVVDMLLAAGYSPAAILWMGLSIAFAIGALALPCLKKHAETLVQESVDRALGPQPGGLEVITGETATGELPALPQRIPGATLDDHYADDTLALFGPIDEPLAYGAQVVDHDEMTWTRIHGLSLVTGIWRNEHGVVLSWEVLRLRHPVLTDPGVSEAQRLRLADDSIPLEDIEIADLAFVGAVLADIDDLATGQGEQR